MSERSHLSIGEVLNLLQEEFPDITISKIRFLESQGLLDPERTPSGYRKFYDADIERLRWILRQQRENFLPLKVIKDRLAAGELDDPLADSGLAPLEPLDDEEPALAEAPVPAGASSRAATSAPARPHLVPAPSPMADGPARGDRRQAGPAPTPAQPAAAQPAAAAPARAVEPSPAPAPPTPRAEPDRPAASAGVLDAGATSVSLSVDELAAATGLTAREIGDLERYGLLASRSLGSTTYYDDDAMVVARVAAGFMAHGVEPRHLRMYKVAAEREAGTFEQLVLPMLKQRNPGARRQATELVGELSDLGVQLRAAMLRQAVRELLGPV